MTFAYWIGSYALFFLVLFAKFFKKTYSKAKTVAPKPEENGFAKGSLETNGNGVIGVKENSLKHD